MKDNVSGFDAAMGEVVSVVDAVASKAEGGDSEALLELGRIVRTVGMISESTRNRLAVLQERVDESARKWLEEFLSRFSDIGSMIRYLLGVRMTSEEEEMFCSAADVLQFGAPFELLAHLRSCDMESLGILKFGDGRLVEVVLLTDRSSGKREYSFREALPGSYHPLDEESGVAVIADGWDAVRRLEVLLPSAHDRLFEGLPGPEDVINYRTGEAVGPSYEETVLSGLMTEASSLSLRARRSEEGGVPRMSLSYEPARIIMTRYEPPSSEAVEGSGDGSEEGVVDLVFPGGWSVRCKISSSSEGWRPHNILEFTSPVKLGSR